MANRPQKPPEDLKGHRSVNQLLPMSEGTFAIPEMPDGLLPETQQAWLRHFASETARYNYLEDWTLVLLWVQALDNYHRAMRRIRSGNSFRAVTQPKGQPATLSRWYIVAERERKAVITLSERLGVGPVPRLRLGIRTRSTGRAGRAIREAQPTETVDDAADDEPDLVRKGELV
jgi:phage terminase small subunit